MKGQATHRPQVSRSQLAEAAVHELARGHSFTPLQAAVCTVLVNSPSCLIRALSPGKQRQISTSVLHGKESVRKGRKVK